MSPQKAVALPSVAGSRWLDWPETQAVFALLSQEGIVTRAVGGAVRNTLLDEPVKDVDLATTASPQKVISLAEAAGLRAIPTGIDHGTITLVAGERSFEVTTLRCDVETHGRHATVAFTTDWKEDASRRDFTINALYAAADGTLFDPLGGYADLKARKVRFIGDPGERIREDYLRILRFFRINAQFGSAPYSQAGLNACVRERNGLGRLSAERIHAEMLQLLTAPDAITAVQAMYDCGLLLSVLGGVPNPIRLHRLIGVEAELGEDGEAIRRLFALAILVDEDVERLTQRLKLSNAEAKALNDLGPVRKFAREITEREAKSLLYVLGPSAYRDLGLLALSQATSKAGIAAWHGLWDLAQRWSAPVFPLKGGDLVSLGLPEGQAIGEVLSNVESQWIANDFHQDRAALLTLARCLIEADARDNKEEPA